MILSPSRLQTDGWTERKKERESFVVVCFYFVLCRKLYFCFNPSFHYVSEMWFHWIGMFPPPFPFSWTLYSARTWWGLMGIGWACGSCLGLHHLSALSALCSASLLPIRPLLVCGSLSHPTPPHNCRYTGSSLLLLNPWRAIINPFSVPFRLHVTPLVPQNLEAERLILTSP